jgi:phospholipid transport system substrate-binding protein
MIGGPTLLISVLLLLGPLGVAQAADDPRELVMQTTERVLTELRHQGDGGRDPRQVRAVIDEIVLPHFDFVLISRAVLGKHWRDATPEQKRRFPVEFRTLLLRTYGTALVEYSNETVVYLPLTDSGRPDVATVRTEVRRSNGGTIPVNYRLRRKSETWKLYDIAIDGISLVANYRSSFASQIRRKGLERLISQLEDHNRQAAETAS